MKAVQKEREEKLVRLLKDFIKIGFLHHEAKRLSGAGLLSNYFLLMLFYSIQSSI